MIIKIKNCRGGEEGNGEFVAYIVSNMGLFESVLVPAMLASQGIYRLPDVSSHHQQSFVFKN